MKKYIFKITLLILLISLSQILCSASSEMSTTFYYENGKEITVYSDVLSYEEKKEIADFIAFGQFTVENTSNETTRTSLLCTLLGHNLTTTFVREINHNVYTDSPRCVRNEYECVYCTRSSCDYIQNTLVSSIRISSCHG